MSGRKLPGPSPVDREYPTLGDPERMARLGAMYLPDSPPSVPDFSPAGDAEHREWLASVGLRPDGTPMDEDELRAAGLPAG